MSPIGKFEVPTVLSIVRLQGTVMAFASPRFFLSLTPLRDRARSLFSSDLVLLIES